MISPFCSESSWEIMIEDPVDVADQRAMEFGIARWPSGLGMAVILHVCSGCGFVRPQSAGHAVAQGCLIR